MTDKFGDWKELFIKDRQDVIVVIKERIAAFNRLLVEAQGRLASAEQDADILIRSIRRLQAEGWRVDTGHTTSSTTHHSGMSERGETATFVVVPPGTPKVIHAGESSTGFTVEVDSPGPNAPKGFAKVFFPGESEMEAWLSAASSDH